MAYTSTELAWAAGFVDGEGCFTAGAGKWPQIIVTQVDTRPLHRLRAALGLGRVVPRPESTRPHNARPQHEWTVRDFEGVQQSIVLLWPYLSEPKREQAHRMMLTVRSNCRRIGRRHVHQKLTTQQVTEVRERVGSVSQAHLAREYGVSQTLVSQIVRGTARRKG